MRSQTSGCYSVDWTLCRANALLILGLFSMPMACARLWMYVVFVLMDKLCSYIALHQGNAQARLLLTLMCVLVPAGLRRLCGESIGLTLSSLFISSSLFAKAQAPRSASRLNESALMPQAYWVFFVIFAITAIVFATLTFMKPPGRRLHGCEPRF